MGGTLEFFYDYQARVAGYEDNAALSAAVVRESNLCLKNELQENKLQEEVERFSRKMTQKLIHQKEEHGYSGWNIHSDEVDRNIRRKLLANIEREDWVDVANLAMMLNCRKEE